MLRLWQIKMKMTLLVNSRRALFFCLFAGIFYHAGEYSFTEVKKFASVYGDSKICQRYFDLRSFGLYGLLDYCQSFNRFEKVQEILKPL